MIWGVVYLSYKRSCQTPPRRALMSLAIPMSA